MVKTHMSYCIMQSDGVGLHPDLDLATFEEGVVVH
jgi:hypothetical protein